MDYNPSLVVGVFRRQEDADQAMQALKEAGFPEDQLHITPYNVQIEGITDTARLVVSVMAGDKNQEAVDILVNHGANNADLPVGTTLDENGTLVNTTPIAEATTTIEQQEVQESRAEESEESRLQGMQEATENQNRAG